MGKTWWEKGPASNPEVIEESNEGRHQVSMAWCQGASEINYCDFGDLTSIVVTIWDVFEAVLGNMEWAKATLGTPEKSRNIGMHGGSLAKEDVERIGMKHPGLDSAGGLTGVAPVGRWEGPARPRVNAKTLIWLSPVK